MISLPNKIYDVELCDSELLCPQCGHDHMHHSSVLVWHREDDAETGTFVLSNEDETFTFSNWDMKDCPSKRRGAVGILLQCEECWGESLLRIIQHKGVSYLEWEVLRKYEPPNPEPLEI